MSTRAEEIAHAERKVYLGDSVYIEIEDGMFKLTTENGSRTASGVGPSNTIYLQPEVYTALTKYVERAYAAYAEKDEEGRDDT